MGQTHFFNGLIKCFNQTSKKGRFYLYSLELVPSLWLLTLKKNSRIFQKLNVPEIIKTVLTDGGILSDRFSFRMKGQFEKREYCVQYRETDFDFISRLMAEEGIFYFFDHDKEKHLMIMGNTSVDYIHIKGNRNILFNTGSAMVPEEEHVTAFELGRSIHSGKVTLKDYNFLHPTRNMITDYEQKPYKQLEVYDYPGKYDTYEKGESLSKIRLEEQIQFKEKGSGKSVSPRFTPGSLFTLKAHPIDAFNRRYLVVTVNHHGHQPQVLEELASTDEAASYESSFTVIPDQTVYRPSTDIRKPKVEGIETAVVTGIEGEEIYTDRHGRVKVQFHWDREGKYNEKSSCWIRVSQTMAGKGWGTIFVPRMGQEVVVDFINGDPDRPLIIGSVYHMENQPPYTLPGERTKSAIKTNSSPSGKGFNEIRMEDKKGSEQIFIHAEKNKDIRIKNDRLEWVGNDSHLIVEKNRLSRINGDTHETVKGDANNKIDGTLSLSVLTDVQTTVKNRHALDAGKEIHLKGGVKVVIEAGSRLTLKVGGNFVDISSSGVTIKGGVININSGGSAVSGSGASPEIPQFPLEADKAETGKKMEMPKAPHNVTPQAATLKDGAEKGNAFCEICNM